MTGRRSVVGLSLFCALLFSAFAAQSASALPGTTAFTCAPTVNGGAGFSDAHCDNAVATGATFIHTGLTGTVSGRTHIHATNKATKNNTTEPTPAVMTVKNFHGFAEVKITCTEVTTVGATGTNWLSNIEEGGVGGTMQAEGTVEVKYSSGGGNCTTNLPNCTVKVTNVTSKFLTVELAAAEMGVKFSPDVGENFAELTFEGATCALKGVVAPVKGSVIATSPTGSNGGGATLVVTPAMSSLTLGGSVAELSQTTTTKMTTNTTEEAAITLTTTTP